MIDFHPLTPEEKPVHSPNLLAYAPGGCEFSFANLFMWGRQRAALVCGHTVLFSQFNRRTVYPYPAGPGDKRAVLDAIMADARERGIPCRITGLDQQAMDTVESLYPGAFRFHCDRNGYDYVYAIDDLADLKGRKYQKKRNHINRFREAYPHCTVRALDESNLEQVRQMAHLWYQRRQEADSSSDFHMEKAALEKAFCHYRALDMEGLVLLDGDAVLAFTLGSRLSPDTWDVHFEKAHPDAEAAYPVINFEYARYIRAQHPDIQFLNREDDMGLEGLRKAKLSYYPHHLVEKCWACLLEDGYAY